MSYLKPNIGKIYLLPMYPLIGTCQLDSCLHSFYVNDIDIMEFVNFIITTCLCRSHVLYNIINNDKHDIFSICVSLTVMNCLGVLFTYSMFFPIF